MMYDYDFEDNPLLTPENRYDMEFRHAISDGTAYERFGFDPDGRHEREQEDKYMNYKPGLHTRSFQGGTRAVTIAVDKFNKAMQKKYDTYEVKQMSPVETTTGTCMYLMFKV